MERQQMEENMKDQYNFWQRQLADLSPTEIPIDRPRPPVQTHNGSTLSVLLPNELAKALGDLSSRHGAELSMILLAALQVLLYRYAKLDEVTVGYTIPGRNHPGVKDLVGYFENILVLRLKIPDNMSFVHLLKQSQDTLKIALANQDLPFTEVVEAAHVSRDLSRTPLFQVMFDYAVTPLEDETINNAAVENFEFDTGIAPYELTLKIIQGKSGLQCLFNYNTDIFDAATIKRLAGHYQTLLDGIAAHPEELISQLPLLTATERHQILVEWNHTATPFPKDRCIHELFEAQARQTPQAQALCFGDRTLTYGELDALSNRMAHYLRRQGVGPETPVGIALEPSIEQMAAVIGILKAGGCYVPLDPEYPPERTAFMLDDTQAKVLLTQKSLMSNMPECDILTILVDEDFSDLSLERKDSVLNKATPENIACIFYTSGSTGKPKGVPVPHYAVNRLVRNTNFINFKPSDRIAQA